MLSDLMALPFHSASFMTKNAPKPFQASSLLRASLKIQHVVLDSFFTKWLNNQKKNGKSN